MGLKDKLSNAGSTLSNLNGGTATVPNFALSKLHYEYSINNTPNIPGKPAPSQLDLDGVNPTSPNRDGNTIAINNSFSNGTYRNSAPAEGIGRI